MNYLSISFRNVCLGILIVGWSLMQPLDVSWPSVLNHLRCASWVRAWWQQILGFLPVDLGRLVNLLLSHHEGSPVQLSSLQHWPIPFQVLVNAWLSRHQMSIILPYPYRHLCLRRKLVNHCQLIHWDILLNLKINLLFYCLQKSETCRMYSFPCLFSQTEAKVWNILCDQQ